MLCKLFFLVYLIEKIKNTINKTAVIIVPESKGSPIVFTKKTSRYPKSPKVDGKSNLNIKRRIATRNHKITQEGGVVPRDLFNKIHINSIFSK